MNIDSDFSYQSSHFHYYSYDSNLIFYPPETLYVTNIFVTMDSFIINFAIAISIIISSYPIIFIKY